MVHHRALPAATYQPGSSAPGSDHAGASYLVCHQKNTDRMDRAGVWMTREVAFSARLPKKMHYEMRVLRLCARRSQTRRKQILISFRWGQARRRVLHPQNQARCPTDVAIMHGRACGCLMHGCLLPLASSLHILPPLRWPRSTSRPCPGRYPCPAAAR